MPKLGETITIDFGTYSPSTGASAAADSTPSVYVFEETTDTAILTPTPVQRTGYTGIYRVQVACTSGNGFEAGKSYSVVASATVETITARVPLTSFQVRTYSSDDIYTQGGTLATSSQVSALSIPTASQNATAVRSELAPELAKIDQPTGDAATASEVAAAIAAASLATYSQVAGLSIPTASENADAVRTELTPEMDLITTNLDAKISEISSGGSPAPGEVTYSDSVEDGAGNPQAGVTITIAEDESGEVTVARTTTAADGTWSVNLVPGTYYAIASKSGWYRVVSTITVEEP